MAENPDEGLPLGPILTPEYLRPTYANFASVGHTPFDFRIVFALLKAPNPGQEMEKAIADQHVSPEAVADLLVPIGVIPGLIAELKENYTRYLDQYGIPGLEQGG